MNRLRTYPAAAVMLLAGSVVLSATGQKPAPSSAAQPPSQKPTVVGAPAKMIVSAEGKDTYQAYCAVCHGVNAKGDGPAAPAMKAAVPDLTAIAARNGGKFNAMRVEDVIRKPGRTATPAHGVDTMPIWGDIFKGEDQARARLRITNLVKYLESIQQPPAGGGRP